MATSRRKPAAPAACETVPATTAHPRIGQRQVVLVLQGGGALGAYQAGVYEALHEAGIEPDWVIGTSIGAINAALIVGNRPEDRLERLRAFWHTVAHKGLPALWPGLPGLPTFWTTLQSVSQGLPGFFTPNHRAWLGQHVALDDDDAGYYHTTDLRDTLDALIDPARLDAGAPRLTVGAVNVRTGAMRYFDSRDEALSLLHVLASGALPPAFPPVRIGDDLYWDGGIYSNTPIEAVFDDKPRRDSLVFAVQLWRPEGDAPQSMWQVSGRQKDISFASRVESHVRRQAQIHRLRHIVRELAKELPAGVLERDDIAEMVGYGCGTVMHVMRLVAPRLPDEDHTKDMDFNTARIAARWSAGREDTRCAIARGAWLEPVDGTEGLVLHDLGKVPTSAVTMP
jgi:NTE family protein